tara:strand:+ start:389 stop:580 length:192 start_codon:yes stop_codon:yes gene_type:complete
MSKTMRKTELTFNGMNFLWKEEDNNSFKVYVDGEIEKSHIHLHYFPTTILECWEFLTEFDMDY